MILSLYRRLEEIVRSDFSDIVYDTKIIYSYTGRARKLRVFLIDESLVDIWYSQDSDYAYHWSKYPVSSWIYRCDNAPHQKWGYVKTFPKHCHWESQGNVLESNLPDKPEDAAREFFSTVRKLMLGLK